MEAQEIISDVFRECTNVASGTAGMLKAFIIFNCGNGRANYCDSAIFSHNPNIS